MNAAHAMRFGATVLRGGGVRFALWAPRSAQVAVQRCDLEGQVIDHFDLQRGADGWHEGVWADAAAGMRYRFVLDAGLAVPDPASRCNPQGVHAPSEVIDPCDHAWTDAGWTGLPWQHASLYELHIGSFTPEGTFDAAAARLPYLHGLGVRAGATSCCP